MQLLRHRERWFDLHYLTIHTNSIQDGCAQGATNLWQILSKLIIQRLVYDFKGFIFSIPSGGKIFKILENNSFLISRTWAMILPSSQNDWAIFASERHIHKFIGEFCLNHNVPGRRILLLSRSYTETKNMYSWTCWRRDNENGLHWFLNFN